MGHSSQGMDFFSKEKSLHSPPPTGSTETADQADAAPDGDDLADVHVLPSERLGLINVNDNGPRSSARSKSHNPRGSAPL